MSKPAANGTVASLILLALYALVMISLNGWQAAVTQFSALWWLMLPLVASFGIQVALYTKLKQSIRDRDKAVLGASGTSATVGMLACCAHHATDVLPLIGLAGLSIFLTRYQIPLLALSLGINLFGIMLMLKHLRLIKT